MDDAPGSTSVAGTARQEAAEHHPRLAWLRAHRCFVLLLALLALLVAIPFLSDYAVGRRILAALSSIILIAAVAAVQRTKLSFGVAVCLIAPALVFQYRAQQTGDPADFAVSWAFNAAFYAFTLGQLLEYVLRRDDMTTDKLYGAVAAYIMLGVFWAFCYGLVQFFYPGAFTLHGTIKVLDLSELIFFSFVVLTSTGFGDIVPALIQTRFMAILEAMSGVMYVAILIARLTGVYPTR
jgi:hypothetical protein